jgi:hypothetical protein
MPMNLWMIDITHHMEYDILNFCALLSGRLNSDNLQIFISTRTLRVNFP